jgi:glycosyltransferase involved in cell wall biosynthesis
MIHLFINALAASAGGGLTYIRNVIPHLAARDDVRSTILLETQLARELPKSANIKLIERENCPQALRRVLFEQRAIPELIRDNGADVLLSAGNFALWNSPVPQILLSRNSLYTSRDFRIDLRARGEYRLWIDTQVKGILGKWSIHEALTVVAPSAAFAAELTEWTGKAVTAIHHGFDREIFVRDRLPLPGSIRQKIDSDPNALRLLFVSHYNYYRNFETLINALPLIKKRMAPRAVRLFLTCRLSLGDNPGGYPSGSAAELVRKLGLADEVVELGPVPYNLLHHVYRSANLYVTPAYAESFAHPLVEAMSSGLPVVASDLPVHREICGPAALYFPRFSSADLASQVCKLAGSDSLAAQCAEMGLKRSEDFSWKTHVECILSLAGRLLTPAI